MAAEPDSGSDQEQPQDNKNNKQLQSRQKPRDKSQSKEDDNNNEPPKKSFRTVQQQQKHDNFVKQEHNKAQENDYSEQANRSRSASRRARRKRITAAIESGKYMKTNSLEALEEADANGELQQMGMFERIGPDSTSMDGPVTFARAQRGEIPMRGTDPNQPYRMPEIKKQNELNESEGLKLTLEANLDIEIELKASIRGDLTLSLL